MTNPDSPTSEPNDDPKTEETEDAVSDTQDSSTTEEPKEELPLTPEQEATKEKIVEVLCDVYDPEIPVSIHALGMIYHIDVYNLPEAVITMTLTSPACPVAGTLPGEVETRIQEVEGIELAKVNLVWEPPWTPELMSEAAKLSLNMY